MPPSPPSSSGAAWHRADGSTAGGLWDAKCHSVPLLKELGRVSRVGVTTNMALLTELSSSPSLKIRIRCRALHRFRARAHLRFAQYQRVRKSKIVSARLRRALGVAGAVAYFGASAA